MSAEYDTDPDDGLLREIVGPWAREKHERIGKFVDISRGARRKYIAKGQAGATYVELFSGPGRAVVENTNDVLNGSAVAAWKKSVEANSPFSQIFIADLREDLVTAAVTRLRTLGAPVRYEIGPAAQTVDRIIKALNPHALHFVVLDPHGLKDLPFDIIKKFARLKRPDILVHVSLVAIKRNLSKALQEENRASFLDDFAPGWEEDFPSTSDERAKRNHMWKHWRKLVISEGLGTAETAEIVSASQNQSLYWLAFAAKHKLALGFWEKIRNVSGQRHFDLV